MPCMACSKMNSEASNSCQWCLHLAGLARPVEPLANGLLRPFASLYSSKSLVTWYSSKCLEIKSQRYDQSSSPGPSKVTHVGCVLSRPCKSVYKLSGGGGPCN